MSYSFRHLANLLSSPSTDEGRRDVRRQVRGIQCSAGYILDFSASGMRIETTRPWKQGRIKRVKLSANPFTLTLRATGVWCRREAWRRYTVGIVFAELHQQELDLLALLAARHGLQYTDARAG